MPFIIVHGIPKDASWMTLEQLSNDIAEKVAAEIPDVPVERCHPIFPEDRLGKIKKGRAIYARIDTGLFGVDTEATRVIKNKVTNAVTDLIWDAFGGKYLVETFPMVLDPRFKAIKQART